MRQPDERDLRTALREEADRHHPDRQAMLDRIAEGRNPSAQRPMQRVLLLLRPMAAAVAVAVLLVLAVAGVRLGNRGPEEDDTPVAAPPAVPTTPAPATAASTAVTPTGRAPEPTGPAPAATTPPRATRTSTSPSSPAPRTTPPSSAPVAVRDGFLSSTGEVDPNSNNVWMQDTLLLDVARPLTALDVTIEVALTDGVVEAGRFSTAPADVITVTSRRTGRALVFHFTLQAGSTLAPGRYRFAGQFNHAAGRRPAADDGYAAEATAEGESAKVSGGFTPAG